MHVIQKWQLELNVVIYDIIVFFVSNYILNNFWSYVLPKWIKCKQIHTCESSASGHVPIVKPIFELSLSCIFFIWMLGLVSAIEALYRLSLNTFHTLLSFTCFCFLLEHAHWFEPGSFQWQVFRLAVTLQPDGLSWDAFLIVCSPSIFCCNKALLFTSKSCCWQSPRNRHVHDHWCSVFF